MQMSTLYASDPPDRFFLIPDDAELPPGDLQLKTLTGKTLETTAEAVAPYALSDAEARAHAGEQMKQMAGRVGRVFGGVRSILEAVGAAQREAEAATAGPFADALDGQEARASDALGVDAEQLRGDPEAVMQGIGDVFHGLASTFRAMASEAPADQEVVRERVQAMADVIRREGLAPEAPADGAPDPVASLPEPLRSLLPDPTLEQASDEATRSLREATEQLRAGADDLAGGAASPSEPSNDEGSGAAGGA